MRSLLLEGADVGVRDEFNRTPLHYAGSAGIAKILLENGAYIDAESRDSETPLHRAVDRDNYEVTSLLLRFGANVNVANSQLKTPLHMVKSVQIAMLLLKNMALVNAGDNLGSTPLHEASKSGHATMIQVLTKFGADVKAVDNQDRTALHLACEAPSDLDRVVKALLGAGVNVKARNKDGRTAMEHAVHSKREDAVLAMLVNNMQFFEKNPAETTDIRLDRGSLSWEAIGKILDASIKLRAAGLPMTEENLRILVRYTGKNQIYGTGRDQFYGSVERTYLRYQREKIQAIELECQKEV